MKFKARYLGILGIIIFIWLILKTDFTQFGALLKEANYYFLIPAFIFFILNLIGNFLRWHYLVNWLGIKISRKRAISLSFQSLFAEHTPGKVGEPIVKAIYLKNKTKSSFSNSLFTTVFHKFIDLWSTFIQAIVVIGILFFMFKMDVVILIPSIVLFAIAIASLFVLVYNRKLTTSIVKPFFNLFVPKKYKDKIKDNFVEFYNNFEKVSKRVIVISFIYDLIIVLLTAISLLFIALSLNFEISFIHLVMVVPLLTIAVGLPISIAGIGLREATFVYYFSLLGVQKEIGLAFGLIFFLFRIISLIPGLILSFTKK